MNSTITQPQDIHIHRMEIPREYNFGMVQAIETLGKTTQNRVEANVKKTFLRKEINGYLYRVEVSNRTQTNTEGTLGIEEALSFLFRRVILLTNIKGEIIDITNRPKIREEWHGEERKFRKRFKNIIPDLDGFLIAMDYLIDDKHAFLDSINKSELFTLLFPPIYEQKLASKKVIAQQKDLHNFFGDNALAIEIDTLLKSFYDEGDGVEVMRSGTLDKQRFNMDGVKKYLRETYATPNLSVQVNANYLEVFDLCAKCEVAAATQMLNVEVEHIYNLRQFANLKEV